MVMRATVFLAFNFLASTQLMRLMLSSCSTARKRSQSPTLASERTCGEVDDPAMVRRSVSFSNRFSSSELGSTTVMLCLSSVNDLAR